ncbi:helix-turn-helix transcriptional regulator [Gloeobacter violaceus]|nr:AraC family transcriptional regulator [Gloeobacter violaceus]
MSEQVLADLGQELNAHTQYPDPQDELDLLWRLPSWLAEGCFREIALREGLALCIENFRLRDRWELALPEREECLCFHFHLSGEHRDGSTEVGNLEYALYGSGLAPKQTMAGPDHFPILEVHIWMQPEVLVAFVGHNGELPTEFAHLVRPADQKYYTRVGTVSPALQQILRQIVRCPYSGLAKRLYLEAKALEAAALVLEHEQEVRQGRCLQHALQSDCVERICRAREIVLQNLDRPLALAELARRVGLNECALKRGFRQVFGTTVFGYLRDYRLEQARQLLLSGEANVSGVMQAVGFADRGHFAAAFRKKFGVAPKDYR